MSWGALIGYTYLAGCVIALVPTARWIQRHMNDGDDDPADLAMAVMMALVTSWLWPLLIPGAWLYRILRMDAEDAERSRR